MSWRRYIAPYVDNVVRLSILHRCTGSNEVWTHVWT